MADDDYVYDEASGEWISAADAAARADAGDAVEVRDSVGNLLADGDQVTLIKDLVVKGAGQTLKRSRGWCCARNSCASAERVQNRLYWPLPRSGHRPNSS
jgi:hypothetical protein